jgi:hypothetical protein
MLPISVARLVVERLDRPGDEGVGSLIYEAEGLVGEGEVRIPFFQEKN